MRLSNKACQYPIWGLLQLICLLAYSNSYADCTTDLTYLQQQVYVGSSWSYQFEEEASTCQQFICEIAAGPGNIDHASNVISWTPSISDIGVHSIEVGHKAAIVVPMGGLKVLPLLISKKICLMVRSQNRSPVIESLPPTSSIDRNSPFAYQVVATDPDGDSLTYTLQQGPSGMTLNSTTGNLEWIATTPGFHSIALTVSDPHGLAAQQTFDLTVLASNQGPIISSLPPTISMMRNTKFVYAVQAYDLDNDALTFSLTYGPSGMTMSSTGTLEWVPNSGGTYSVILKVTDGLGLSTSQSFSIKVYADNQQPKIMSLPPIGSVRLNETLVYPIEAIDPDGDTLSYQVAQIYYPVYASCYTCPPAYYLPAPTGNYEVLMSSYGRFQFTPKAYCTPFTTCNYLVIVSVVDGRGAVSQQSFNISIDISNRAPVITSRPPTDHISRYTIFTYQLEASDPDGDPVSFALLQGPKHISTTTNDMTLDVVTGYLEWNTSGFGSGVYPVVIEAMDGRGMKTQQSFSITVSENAAAMCAGTPVRFYAKVGLPFRIVEDGCQNYTCTFTSAPTGVSFDGATLKWTPTSVQVGTRIISVHRNSGLSSDWSYCVDVLANSSPVFVSIPPAGAVAGKYFSYQLQVEDSENDVRNYQLIDGPAGLSMNLHTGLLSGVPTQAGKYNVTVQATTWDNYYVRQTFELHVLAAEIVVTVSTEYYRANNIPSGVEETIYVHSDMAGSPLARTDAGGDLVSRTEYSPYGEQLGGASGTLDDKISFAGHSVDENIGLSYMGARYYEPFVGRFMGMDPLGFDELNLHSLNRYIYANNNPYKFVDPNGLESINLNLGVGFGPGFNLGISIDPQTGNVYAIGGIGVGVGLAATSTYSSATPVQGYSWNFEGAAGLPGAVPVGGTVSASWDASAYSSTGQHMLSLGESVGYGMGAGFAVTGTFQGSWEIGNLGDSINWWMDLLGFSQGLPPYLCY